MAKISKDDFLKGLTKSNLLKSDQLTQFLGECEDGSAEAIAKRLIREKHATNWQAKYLLSGRTRLDIGSYRLLERIHRDEFGDRFLAVHTSLARKVDIQVLPGSLTKEKSRCDEFIQKASRAAKLDHPNLTHVYDIDQEGGRYFLVTEHIQGTTLEETNLKELSESEIVSILSQAIEGISYAHANNVIHGCIGLADFVVDSNQNIKIQHLPLSPLRQQISDSDERPTAEHDFSAIARMGQFICKSTPNVKHRDELSAILKSLNAGTAESVVIATDGLKKLSVAEPDSSGGIDEFAGGFDQPIATVSSPAIKAKTKNSSDEETEDEPVEEVVKKPGYVGSLWQNNPVAVIASVAVISLLFIGGSIFGVTKLIGTKHALAASSTLDKPSPAAEPDLAAKSDANDKPKNDRTSNKTVAGKEPLPSDEQMDSFLNNIGGKDSLAGNKNQNKDKNAPGNAIAKQPAAAVENPIPPAGDAPEVAAKRAIDGNNGLTNVSTEMPKTDVPKTEVEVAATAPTVEPEKKLHTDLTVIRGIAEATQNTLNKGEVKSLEKIASLSPQQIREAIRNGGWSNANKIDEYKRWITQAKEIIGDETPMSTVKVAKAEAPADPDAAPPANATGPFAKFPRLVELPPTEDTTELKLGDLTIKAQYLLGAELVCEPGIAKGRTYFELERTQEDKQKWMVGVKRSEKHKPIFVATFRKSPEAVFFQWLPAATEDKAAAKLVPFLRNCFLKLTLPEDETTFVTLRKPIKIPDLRLTADSLTNRVEFSIPGMPRAETIVVEVLPLRIPNVETHIPNSRIEKSQPATIWLKKQDKTGFLWMQVAGDMRSKLKLQSNLMLLVQGKVQPVNNLSTLDELANVIDRAAVQAQQIHDNFFKPEKMTKTDFDAKKSQLAKDAKAKQALKEKILNYREILPTILDKPISVRVYAKLGNMQTILAVSDPSLPQEDDRESRRK